MCSCDSISPDAYVETWRKARTVKRCEECWQPIFWGERYQYVSGIWDGKPDSYITCKRCVELREVHKAADKAAQLAELRRDLERQLRATVRAAYAHLAPRPTEHELQALERRVVTCEAPMAALYETIRECSREDGYRAAFRAEMKRRRDENRRAA